MSSTIKFLNLLSENVEPNILILIDQTTKFNEIKISTENAYNIYLIRSRLHTKEKNLSSQFEILLKSLLNYNGDFVKISSIIINDLAVIMFTDDAGEKNFIGRLIFDKLTTNPIGEIL